MRNCRIVLLCLLALTGIACTVLSWSISIATPTDIPHPTLYSLEDALTLAIQSIEAQTQKAEVAVPITGEQLPTVTAIPVPIATPSALLGEHHVALGETISCIGRAYGVSPKAIADANGIDLVSELQVGQVLVIPAVSWAEISEGPVCARQFALPTGAVEVTVQAQATSKPTGDGKAGKPSSGSDAQKPADAAENPADSSPCLTCDLPVLKNPPLFEVVPIIKSVEPGPSHVP